MKILVTGCSGTIGTRLCEKLLSQGQEVVGADWEPCKWNTEVEQIRIDCDLRDSQALKVLPTDIDLVIHLAANARVYELVENPDRAFDNAHSTYNTLEYVRKNGIKKFMFASSRETYGNIKIEEDKYSEDKANFAHCESPYTASKIAGEAFTESYKRCYDIETIIYRFSNVYGMYDDSVRLIPLFFKQVKNNELLHVFGEKKYLDFTYIDDCVEGILLGIEKWDQAKNDTYNIAYGEGSSILHVAEKMIELTQSSSKISIEQPRTGEVIKYIADTTKAEKKLGFSPKTPLDEGLEKSVEWYSNYFSS
ncbi:NAD-dependent epimerase/dehydratase family protein [Candidatus Peregrinibacteria bacterium]|nr:NAD-dependent epimerase/dehydratase family protein [Candidatus Peregrinibacteria bacterium]MBT3598693.1 NAD-dependent epimerase/dehydratase family protein [Candidatus Peregrinibacteria bacterium]MBT4367295.1 NAD-dependent epimerase/dehydratase family protein [Candidatus Peregrinibacteria bacterium]MBT4586219.1 NAD-dependent epimerase/dehydratase family protein [Candidatus Peregrinibacteria bacterium]MBT6730469.1 NAD-dependent epimerase/dehydratase family protein [Candidatus Peregrinibacteria